jgi:hypothetical protein
VSALIDFFGHNPAVGTLAVFFCVVMAHVLVGALLHALRLHDFDWDKLGQFVETDFGSRRAVVAFSLALGTVISDAVPGSTAHSLAQVFLTALVPVAAANTLPVLRDTLRELYELVTGQASRS